MSASVYGEARKTSETELRANARRKVAGAAKQGRRPADEFSADDLAWAFRGHEDELAALDMEAAETRARRAKRQQEQQLTELARSLELELIEQEKRDRWERALTEAKKRLGIE